MMPGMGAETFARLLCGLAIASMVACTSGSSPAPLPTSTPTSEATAPALQDAVRAYSAAYLGGEADVAWSILSSRCQDRLGRSEFNALVSGATALYGDAKIQDFHIDELAGTLARVTYTFDNPAINQDREPWSFEDGAWKEDDC